MSVIEVLNFLKKSLGIITKRLEEEGVVVLGMDTEGKLHVLRVDSEGRLQTLQVVEIPNIDVALSTRASEATLSAIKSKTDNLDVLLSTRASEATLSAIKNALESVGTDRFRVVGELSVSELNVTKVGGVAVTGRDWSSDFAMLQNLDVALTVVARLIRWGRDVTPTWTVGSEVTAPAAGSTLVSVSVPSGSKGYIYGVYINVGEGNDFKINWTSGGTARSIRISFAGKGTVLAIYNTPINEGLPADGGTSITITNVNAGSSGIVYQAGLLVGIE